MMWETGMTIQVVAEMKNIQPGEAWNKCNSLDSSWTEKTGFEKGDVVPRL